MLGQSEDKEDDEPEAFEIRGKSDVLGEARPQTTEHDCSVSVPLYLLDGVPDCEGGKRMFVAFLAQGACRDGEERIKVRVRVKSYAQRKREVAKG
jgi:hypothetical protein